MSNLITRSELVHILSRESRLLASGVRVSSFGLGPTGVRPIDLAGVNESDLPVIVNVIGYLEKPGVYELAVQARWYREWTASQFNDDRLRGKTPDIMVVSLAELPGDFLRAALAVSPVLPIRTFTAKLKRKGPPRLRMDFLSLQEVRHETLRAVLYEASSNGAGFLPDEASAFREIGRRLGNSSDEVCH